MVAPVAQHGYAADQLPAQQFLQAIGHVGARHAQGLGDVLGRQGLFRQIEQGLDLGHRPVDPPLAAQVAPAQDELFDRRRKAFLNVCYFCHNRNIGRSMGNVKRVGPKARSSAGRRRPCRKETS